MPVGRRGGGEEVGEGGGGMGGKFGEQVGKKLPRSVKPRCWN